MPAFPLYFLLAQVSPRNRRGKQMTRRWFPGLQALVYTFRVLSFCIA